MHHWLLDEVSTQVERVVYPLVAEVVFVFSEYGELSITLSIGPQFFEDGFLASIADEGYVPSISHQPGLVMFHGRYLSTILAAYKKQVLNSYKKY